MTPERHHQIATLYNDAIDLAPEKRPAFLDRSCAGDTALREEVESLLALDEKARDFIEGAPFTATEDFFGEVRDPLPAGRTIGFYRILSSLGAGGMGEVYLAEDTRLRRQIALKLLLSRFTQEPERLRLFEQEARAASTLNHPNIITIHDIGEVEGRPFIATEFVNGDTLRQRIARGPVGLTEALEIATQIGNALTTAHTAGVVHRDIKPENIMLRADGYVKVLDFGVAKLAQTDETRAVSSNSVTSTGVVGTVRYMSPEQTRGRKVDARSDIFSLGVVLYEMLAGRAPFERETAADEIAAILGQEPVLEPDIPDAVKPIITKALRKDRDERYQTAGELVADLKALKLRLESESGTARTDSAIEKVLTNVGRHKGSALLVFALALIAAILFLPTAGNTVDSLAVLPFVNEGNEPTEYLSSGISDNLIYRLRQFPDLHVRSHTATLPYLGKSVDAQTVGRELNVRAVLRGWLKTHGDALSVRAELVDARDNHVLWSGRYDNRRIDQVLQLQDEIVRNIADLGLRSTAEQKKLLVKQAAYWPYVKGRRQWDKPTPERLQSSITYFEEAVKEDANFALAYAGLADSYSLLGEISEMAPREAFSKAESYANKALELDKSLPEPWTSIGIVNLFYKWDWKGAEEALNRARSLTSDSPDVYHFYGHYLQMVGRKQEAIAVTRQGLTLAPTSLLMNAELGWAFYCARQYDDAIAQWGETLRLETDFPYASWGIAQAYEQEGKYKEALDKLEATRGPSPDWSWIVADIGYVYARIGEPTKSLKIIQELKDRSKAEYIDPVLFAYIYIALRDNDEAFVWLEKAREEHTGLLPWLKVEPKFDDIRKDERFSRLLTSIGLPL